ncbi:efflux transporter outer membrane subunit [Sphingobacterium paludis]|uniref:NodT family efflux transporter outer membrane factor (OMF) lipoprotein n=1 Tax=Sphingobacterium paludis TaxID=1476465 RepID=A0A4R7CVI8_9SPHI|nr:efflux transporter outer membrane subunit [Sphingobacterium paludis]TDS12190.1 NodT family efflux transporter outer membrane factor (OMF) lipoprotein [Sphingobacterium paludis]
MHNSRLHRIGLLIGLLSLFASCNVGQRYSRPALDMPDQYRDSVRSLTADTVVLRWKTFFKDPLLIGLIDRALQKNNDLAVALLSMQQVDLTYQRAKRELLPTLNLQVGASRNWFSTNSLNGSLGEQFLGSNFLDDYSATLQLQWEADIWGKAKKQQEEALAQYFAQQENVAALKTRIVAQVAQAYYNLLALDEQVEVASRNIEMSTITLQMIELQYNSGQVNSLAVDQAIAQKKTAELLLPLAKQQIAVQENALSILCGDYPDRVARTGSLREALPVSLFSSGVPAALLSRRPDVKAAEFAVVAANARTGLAQAAMYPTISISPSIGANSFQFNSWFDLPGSLVKNIGANLTQPLFQKGALKTAHEIAKLEQEKAAVQFKQSVMTAMAEVSDALAVVAHSDERLLLVGEKTAALRKASADALLLYQNGMANYLEVITAQSNALQNELDAIAIHREKLQAMTDLYRALGGGVE